MRLIVLVLALVLLASPARAERWELTIPERLELVAGAAAGAGAALPIGIAVGRGLRISKDAAIIVDLAPDSAITVKRRRLGRTDAVDPDADAPRFSVALRADTPGDFALRVRLRFWLCGSKSCRPVDARRNVLISVTTPAAVPTPNPATP